MLGRPLLALAILLTAALAGCASDAPASAVDEAPASVPELPRPEVAMPTFLPPLELGSVTLGAEPSVAVAPDGTVYVTTPLALWRSDDMGKTYKHLGAPACPFGLPQCPGLEERNPGLEGGGDASLSITSDGTVHWAGLGAGIPYQRSTDKGETWSEAFDVSEETGSDREWTVVDARDRLYVQWRGSDDDGSGIFIRASDDAGATWGNVTRAADDGRQGPVAVDPTNTSILLLPHTLDGKLLVARSEDHGETWKDAEVGPVNGRPFIFPIAAFDAAGTAYFVWSEDRDAPQQNAVILEGGRVVSIPTVYLSASGDKGLTWSEPIALSTPGVPAIFPWISAGDAGRVVVAWYEGRQPIPSNRLPNVFDVKVAMSTTADQAEPVFVVAQANEEPVHVGSFCTEGLACSLSGGDRSLLDFFEVRILPDGAPVVAWAADDTAKMARVKVFTTRMDTGTPLL